MPQSDKHFDFAFRGFKFPKQGGSTSIVEGSLTSLLPHNHKIMQKNKEPSVTPNVPKALYFCGFSDILYFLFVSIKRVLFRQIWHKAPNRDYARYTGGNTAVGFQK